MTQKKVNSKTKQHLLCLRKILLTKAVLQIEDLTEGAKLAGHIIPGSGISDGAGLELFGMGLTAGVFLNQQAFQLSINQYNFFSTDTVHYHE